MADGIANQILDTIMFLIFAIVSIIRSLVNSILSIGSGPVKKIKGEKILITGAGNGLGRFLATKLSKLNTTVVLWDIDTKGLEETSKLIKSANPRASVYIYECDLTKREEIYRVADLVKKDVGNITMVINNAGVVSGYYFTEIPDHLIQRTFDVNALAPFWVTKSFLPSMLERKHGHIVTIASMAAHVSCTKLVDYCASKAAAYSFDEGLRLELEAKGQNKYIKTTVVCPYFFTASRMFPDVVTRLAPSTAEEIADRVVWAILREDYLVMHPRFLRYVFWLKWIVPWNVVSKFMISMVPDAVPNPTTK